MQRVQTIYTDNPGAIANAVFELPPGLDLELASVRAKVSGAGAADSFLIVCEVVTIDDKILGQSPIYQPLAVGDTGAFTFAPHLAPQASAGSASVYHKISTASTNAASIKSTPGQVTGYYLVNTALAFSYVKLYDKASSPTVGTDTPLCVFGIPPSSAANVALDFPIAFALGIGIAIVTGIADADATAVAANDVAVTLYYT